jgi:prepilin-type N-terminal cleavage/methylation domain-containing protein
VTIARTAAAWLARRLGCQAGFGMMELVIAMTVMLIGVMATYSMFQSSALQIKRAANTTTAAALADTDMEQLRALRYTAIGLDEAAIAGTDTTYRGDAAWNASAPSRVHVVACGTAPCTTSVPTKTVTGADGRSYRVDTYMTWQTVTSGRNVKLVTIVVRDGAAANKVWARVASSFDESTGL